MTIVRAVMFCALFLASAIASTDARAQDLRQHMEGVGGAFTAKPYQVNSPNAFFNEGANAGAKTAKSRAHRARAIARARAKAKAQAARKATITKSKTAKAPVIVIPSSPPASAPEVASVSADKSLDHLHGTTTGSIQPTSSAPAKPEKQVCRKYSAMVGGLIEMPCK